MTLIEMLRQKADDIERSRACGPSVIMLLRDAAKELEKQMK